MSYILDALRRAQAERERGQVPNLHAQTSLDVGTRARAAAAGPKPRLSPLWALGGAALGALLLLLVFWLTRGGRAPPTAAAPAAAAAPLPGGGLATAGPATGPALPLPTDGQPLVVVSARPDVRPETRPAVPPLTTGQAPAAAPAGPPPGAALPQGARAANGAAVVLPAAGAAPVPPPPSPPAPAALPPPLAAAAPTGAGAVAAEPPPPSAPRQAPPQAAATPALPPLLTTEQLREWPPVALGGSVWSETPSARFVILGGQVVREGDSTPDGVLVERILPKAVVLRWRDLRGTLPL